MNIRFIKYVFIFFAFLITLGANASLSDNSSRVVGNSFDVATSEQASGEVFNFCQHNDIITQNLNSQVNYIFAKNKKNNDSFGNNNSNHITKFSQNDSELALQKIHNFYFDISTKDIQKKVFLTEIFTHAP